MKKKVINLFNEPNIIQNKGVKYSKLLERFIEPFVDNFSEVEYYEDMLEFALSAWNFSNLELLLPKDGFKEFIDGIDNSIMDLNLLKKMMAYKKSHFKEYTNFIVDFDIRETEGDPILSVITQSEEDFLKKMFENMENDDESGDFEDNYIDRSAIIVKPLQPFIDWCSDLYPDDIEEIKEPRVYLISEDIFDIESWVKKKFKKIFEFELESWHVNKKEWPQRRNYKMFKEWFEVDISLSVYDLEKKPVIK
ncbi:hypothetical protein P8625_10085 [Tenacibaculum tangerinum]|uniref:DUF5063 domain-containing protein n=1 Tax=Tenacibaculum tangerinum TaxID=3038772 RepID=A0ABY8KYZ1_9FLAO|nr:hypothetical protein [Tenacibaculum tangerinum]WGH74453.1 hypothetical protein P8625_10085 [Tenacibaculum tangerinum]